MKAYFYDQLDAFILRELTNNPDIAYAKIAEEYGVSVGTIHVRLDKMRSAGVIEKAKINIIHERLGYECLCFIGITLSSARAYKDVINQLKQINEVVEAYYTTGRYSIFIKVITSNISTLHHILTERIQSIDSIQSTDTIISLDRPISRTINLYREEDK